MVTASETEMMKVQLKDAVKKLQEAHDACSDTELKEQCANEFRTVGGTVNKEKQFSISSIDIARADKTYNEEGFFHGNSSQITKAITSINSIAGKLNEIDGKH